MDSNCIPANPDIAGIGIRVSLYAQAVLVFVPIALLPFTSNPLSQAFRRYPNPPPAGASGLARALFDDVSVNVATVYVTGIALLIATFIQARLSSFDLYHGFVVLNLSWLNVLTIFMPVYVATMAKRQEGLRRGQEPTISWEHVAFVLYFSAVGAYGSWLSYRLSDFGSFPECNPLTVWVLAGRSVAATSPALRAFLLAVSSIAAFPGVNFGVLFAASIIVFVAPVLVVLLPVYLMQCLFCIDTGLYGFYRGHRGSTAYLVFVVSYFLMTITASIIIIASTEQLIAFNKPNVGDGENDWTFGQTLALLLLAPSLWQVVARILTAIGCDDDSTTVEEDRQDEPGTARMQPTTSNGEGLSAQEPTRTEPPVVSALTQRPNAINRIPSSER